MLPLTADTITNEQIRELMRHVAKTPGIGVSDRVFRDCTIALRARRETLTSIPATIAHTYPTTAQRRSARARCAEIFTKILNARNAL